LGGLLHKIRVRKADFFGKIEALYEF